jgi:predicted nucleotidyltransferase
MRTLAILDTKMKGNHGGPSKALLKEVVQRIVRVAHPQKIILFGSAARREMGPHSDLDLLVVKKGVRGRATTFAIYKALRGITTGIDIVVATPSDLSRHGDSPSLVYYPALREGRVIYDAQAASS